MQAVKTMFRSPRFLIGLFLVMTVVLYAVFYPMVDRRDPKENRLPNEAYAQVEPLRQLLEEARGQEALQEIDRLVALEEDAFGSYQPLYALYTELGFAQYKIHNRSSNTVTAAVDKMDWSRIRPAIESYIREEKPRFELLSGMLDSLQNHPEALAQIEALRQLDLEGLSPEQVQRWQALLSEAEALLSSAEPLMAAKLVDDYYKARGPLYLDTLPLVEALQKTADELAAETVNLNLLFEQYVTPTLLTVRQKINSTAVDKALSAVKQIKRSHPLYQKLDGLRTLLSDKALAPEDRAAQVTAETERLTAHHAALAAAVDALLGEGAGALEVVRDQAVKDELSQLPAEGLADAAKALLAQHEETLRSVETAARRLRGEGLSFGGVKPGDPSAIKLLTDGIPQSTLTLKNQPPSREHPLGTDMDSRDVLLEMAHGARLSLMVGLIAGCIATLIGIVIGLIAGYVGSVADSSLTTLTNLFLVIPSFVILILLSIAMGQIREASTTGIIIGLTAWPWTAKSVRAQTVSLRYRDHVNMARISGYPTWRIILTEILPYIASYVVMAFILQVASGIISEATLSVLGLGDPSAISLGRMINRAQQFESIVNSRWWEFVPVAICIAMMTFGLYMMNSGMDQVFNPKIRS